MRAISARPGDLLNITTRRHGEVLGYFAELLRADAKGNVVLDQLWTAASFEDGHAFTILKEGFTYNFVLFPELAEGAALEVVIRVEGVEYREMVTESRTTSWPIVLA